MREIAQRSRTRAAAQSDTREEGANDGGTRNNAVHDESGGYDPVKTESHSSLQRWFASGPSTGSAPRHSRLCPARRLACTGDRLRMSGLPGIELRSLRQKFPNRRQTTRVL